MELLSVFDERGGVQPLSEFGGFTNAFTVCCQQPARLFTRPSRPWAVFSSSGLIYCTSRFWVYVLCLFIWVVTVCYSVFYCASLLDFPMLPPDFGCHIFLEKHFMFHQHFPHIMSLPSLSKGEQLLLFLPLHSSQMKDCRLNTCPIK